MGWDPGKYLEFADARTRPARDLLARTPLDEPRHVFDLGCGAGNVTRLLARRWPQAAVTGVDNSDAMLAAAAKAAPGVSWVQADVAEWSPPQAADLLFSNATLHWLDDHGVLFPRLMRHLAGGGILAVQMPRNYAAPSHRLMAEAARAGPWRCALAPHLRPEPVAEPAVYYDMLAPLAAALDIWETEYQTVLQGDDPVIAWISATALRPLLEALDEPWRGQFLDAYRQSIHAAYPRRGDGRTILPFRRLFIVARA